MSADASSLRRIAIVPAYNEERNVGRVIDELRAFDAGLDVVVVSDGSADRTAEVAARKEILMMVPVVFLVLPVTVLIAFWPGVIGLHLATP